MYTQIPDLRPDVTEITFEHSSVLLERIKAALEVIEGRDDVDLSFVESISPQRMTDLYSKMFEIDQFSRLFQTEFGKGVLVGCFFHQVMEDIEGETLDV